MSLICTEAVSVTVGDSSSVWAGSRVDVGEGVGVCSRVEDPVGVSEIVGAGVSGARVGVGEVSIEAGVPIGVGLAGVSNPTGVDVCSRVRSLLTVWAAVGPQPAAKTTNSPMTITER